MTRKSSNGMRFNLSNLDKFLFSPLDARAVAWFRIAFAITLPYFFWSMSMKPTAVVPIWMHGFYEFIILTPGHKLAVSILCASLAWGWYPRLCGVLLFILLLPLAFVTAGTVSRPVLLFALLAFSFIPSDAVRNPWSMKNRRQFQTAGPCWPIRIIQLELTVIYGANAIAKSSETYLRGEALMDMSMAFSNFNVDLSYGMLELGPFLLPLVLAAPASTLSEYVLSIGFWFKKWKWLIAAFGISFHFILTKIVSIFMLHYATIFLYLAFLLPLIAHRERVCDGQTGMNGPNRRGG